MADYNRNNNGFRDRRSGGFQKRNFTEMHKAICDKCGNECEVPFRPTSGKPVYCNNCFEKGNNRPRNNDQPQAREQSNYNQQFESLNTKLDRILEILESAISDEAIEEELVEEETPKAAKKPKASKKTKSPTEE